MLIRHAAVLIVASGLCASAHAIHMHCEVRPWSVELTPTPNTPYPILFTSTPTPLTFMNVLIPLPAPGASTMPNCMYELSDLTMIRITLQLSAGDQLRFTSFSTSLAQGMPVAPTNPGPYLFTTQTATKVFTFPPHETGTPMSPELIPMFPGPVVNITLAGGTALGSGPTPPNLELLGATVEISGNHYFLPEPGSVTLLLCSGMLALRRRRV